MSDSQRAHLSALAIGRSVSLETRAKLSAASKGKPKSPEHRAKIAAALLGKSGTKWTPEQRAKLSAARKGRVFSAETRAKISAAHKGRSPSPETRAKLSAAFMGRKRKPFTAETLARMSAAQRGRKVSAEHMEKMHAACRGRVQSPEERAKRSAAQVGKKRRSKCPIEDRPRRDKERRKRWVNANRELMRAHMRKGSSTRRARKAAAFIEAIDSGVVFDRDKGICGICYEAVERNERWDVDHIVPISKGGLHCYANVQLSHSSCNKRKSAKMPAPSLLQVVA